MKPTVGRIVHFHDASDTGPLAAMVTFVHDDGAVELTLFVPRVGTEMHERVAWSETPAAGCWNWPPRES